MTCEKSRMNELAFTQTDAQLLSLSRKIVNYVTKMNLKMVKKKWMKWIQFKSWFSLLLITKISSMHNDLSKIANLCGFVSNIAKIYALCVTNRAEIQQKYSKTLLLVNNHSVDNHKLAKFL